MTYALWVVQVLLALLFVFAGGMKLVLPLDQLAGPVPLPGAFIRFIGVAELLGGLGLILPAARGHHDRRRRHHTDRRPAGRGGDLARRRIARGLRRLRALAARADS